MNLLEKFIQNGILLYKIMYQNYHLFLTNTINKKNYFANQKSIF